MTDGPGSVQAVSDGPATDQQVGDQQVGDQHVRPFNARSLVLSVLLGLPEPELDTPALMRLAGLFDIADGTMRTALSRMVTGDDLVALGGGYRLAPRHAERKAAQDLGRTMPPGAWDGAWWIVAVTAPARALAERRVFRSHMTNARMGELRPDTWLRPANTAAPNLAGSDAVAVRGPLSGGDSGALVARLWDLDAIARRGSDLTDRLGEASRRLERAGAPGIPAAMLVAADCVRYLREEPYLPPALTPDAWPIDDLRQAYREFDRLLGRTLAAALTPTHPSVGRPPSGR